MASASSLGIPSLIGLGAPSTRSLASLRPRLVTSRTTLMTLILVGADLGQRHGELGLLFDWSRGRASGSARRRRHRHRRRRGHTQLGLERLHELRELQHADSLDVLDYLLLCHFGHCSVLFLKSHASRRPLLLRLDEDTHQIPWRGVEHADDLDHRRLQDEEQLGVAARPCRATPPARSTSAGLMARPCTTAALTIDHRRRLRERRQRLGERDRIGRGVGDRRRALEERRRAARSSCP